MNAPNNYVAPKTINLLIPEGFRNELSVDTKTSARICVNYVVDGSGSCDYPYEASVVALVKKIPGFIFSGYREISYAG